VEVALRLLAKLAALSLILAVGLAAAHAQARDTTGSLPLVRGRLDYSGGGGAAADNFFRALRQNAGNVISLDIEIVPNPSGDSPGYSLVKDHTSPRTAADLVCGSDNQGRIDNLRSAYRLSLQHPENFHTPTEIVVGDQLNFPFQSVRCGAEGARERTALHVRGFFVVETAEIPTARSYFLYPYRP
jgi:hypothetical protein